MVLAVGVRVRKSYCHNNASVIGDYYLDAPIAVDCSIRVIPLRTWATHRGGDDRGEGFVLRDTQRGHPGNCMPGEAHSRSFAQLLESRWCSAHLSSPASCVLIRCATDWRCQRPPRAAR